MTENPAVPLKVRPIVPHGLAFKVEHIVAKDVGQRFFSSGVLLKIESSLLPAAASASAMGPNRGVHRSIDVQFKQQMRRRLARVARLDHTKATRNGRCRCSSSILFSALPVAGFPSRAISLSISCLSSLSASGAQIVIMVWVSGEISGSNSMSNQRGNGPTQRMPRHPRQTPFGPA